MCSQYFYWRHTNEKGKHSVCLHGVNILRENSLFPIFRHNFPNDLCVSFGEMHSTDIC